MLLLLIGLAFSSSVFSIPKDPKPSCDLGSYVQKVIIIGEAHTETANEISAYIENVLVKSGKAHYLIEDNSLLSKNNIDNPVLRYYLSLNVLLHAYQQDQRSASGAWLGVIGGSQPLQQIFSAPNLTKVETEALDFLKLKQKELKPNNKIEIVGDIFYYMKLNLEAMETLAVKLYAQAGLFVWNMQPQGMSLVKLVEPETPIDHIGYWSLTSQFGDVSKMRELFMTQRVLDYLCNITDRLNPIIIRTGDSHRSSLRSELKRAVPNMQVETHSIFFRSSPVMNMLESLNR